MTVHLVLAALIALTLGAGTAFAQGGATFRCVDAGGRSTYTNVKEEMTGRRCTPVSREVSVVQTPGVREAKKASPKEGAPGASASKKPASASSRTTDRQRILEDELSDEERRLNEAKQRLNEQQSIRNGDERNYQRVIDRLKPYVDAIEQHEKNIVQLKRELNSIR
jgi:hypothetical protein